MKLKQLLQIITANIYIFWNIHESKLDQGLVTTLCPKALQDKEQ